MAVVSAMAEMKAFDVIMTIEPHCLHNEETEEVCMKGRGVQELVRCKDCVHWGTTLTDDERAEAAKDECVDLVCDYFMTDGLCGNDFCSFGKKRCE